MKCILSLVLVVFTSLPNAGLVTYDGNVFPETVGWERLGTFDSDRWIDDGWFNQYVELGVWAPPPIGQTDVYQRSLADFAAQQAFFIEWRVETDAPSSILDSSGTPVVVSAAGSAAANYHFTITDERVQVIRDNLLPIVFADIEPGVPHTYRLELHGDESYAWYIDGQLMDSGVPEGPYPNSDSQLLWGAQRHTFDATTRWDFIRFGTIEPDAIPTVSQWGLIVMILLVVTTGTIVLRQRRRRSDRPTQSPSFSREY